MMTRVNDLSLANGICCMLQAHQAFPALNCAVLCCVLFRISAMRNEADGWSLLLLDELGTGTDPTEGAALGQALLKTLVRGKGMRRLHRSILTK